MTHKLKSDPLSPKLLYGAERSLTAVTPGTFQTRVYATPRPGVKTGLDLVQVRPTAGGSPPAGMTLTDESGASHHLSHALTSEAALDF